MGFVSFLEGIGILLLVPMISYSGIIKNDFGELKFQKYLFFLHELPKTQALILILAFFISLVIVQNLIQRNLAIRNVMITQGFIRLLRMETYDSLLKSNWGLFTKEKKADLINVMTMELARVSGGIIQTLLLLTSLVFTSIQIVLAIWLSIKLTFLVLISGLILAIFSRKYIKQSKILGSKTSALAQEYLGGITDQLNGIKDIKSNTLELSRINWLSTLTKGMIEEQIEYTKLKTSSQTLYKISSALLISVFIFTYLMIIDKHPEQFLLILIIFSRLWPRLTEIQSSAEQIATTVPAFKALRDLQRKCRQSAEINDNTIYKRIKPLIIEEEVECREVYFRYDGHDKKYALQNINLKIPINSMTAIVGPSGAGKSTLIDILMGLNKPEQGEILIDGKVINEHNLLSLRQSISYVPQEPFLFNASIRDNLLMISPNISEDYIWEALDFSAAAEFVKELPNGLDTIVGDRGIRLSGGERQRLVLARAILRNPSILVLDEATSALDSENEAKIQYAIEKLKGRMTVIVIAHRLSTIKNADQVIVLENGKMVQQGKFSQLATEQKGMFSKLLKKQMGISV